MRFQRIWKVCSLALLVTSCGRTEVSPPEIGMVRQASIAFSGLAAIPAEAETTGVTEGTLVTFGGTAAPVAPDTQITKVEMFYGEINPATGLEFGEVLCDDATATPCGVTEVCDGSHTYRDSLDTNGGSFRDHTARCEVTGDVSASTGSIFVLINEVAATADANRLGPNVYATLEDIPLTITPTFSDPSVDTVPNPDQFYETYTCVMQWGDLTPDDTVPSCVYPNTGTAGNSDISHVYATPGTYTLTVLVTNTQGDGGTASSTATVTVTDSNPTVTIDPETPDPSNEGTSVTFSATVTAPSAEPISSCEWDWGDGSPLEPEPECVSGSTSVGVSASHVYADGDPTTYTVTLRAFDADSNSTDTELHGVDNVAPVVAAPSTASTLVEGGSISYDASFTDAGADPLDDDNWRVRWDFDSPPFGPDETDFPITAAGVIGGGPVVYSAQGTYTVEVRVQDQLDGAGNPVGSSLVGTSSASFTIADAAPSITGLTSNSPRNEGAPVTFSATVASGAPDAGGGLGGSDPIASCEWDPGDGSGAQAFLVGDPQCGGSAPGANSVFVHTYADNGAYSATLTVFDEDSSSAGSTSVTIVNVAPTVVINSDLPDPSFEGGTVAAPNQVVTLDFTVSDPGTLPNEIRTVTINWGETGSTAEVFCDDVGATPPPTCSQGTFTATHTYTDDSEDRCGAAACTITVTATDKDAAAGSASTLHDIDNLDPLINGVAFTSVVPEGQAVSFTVDATDPGTGDLPSLRYSFDWLNDGCSPAQGDFCDAVLNGASFTYPDEGTYTVRVTVKDDDLGSATTTRTVTVTDTKPLVVSFFNTSPKNENQEVTAVVQMNLQTGDAYSFTYDFGDGTPTVTTTSRTQSHLYADDDADDLYTITVTVTDDEGNATSATTIATVRNVPPTGTASNSGPISEGGTATVSASVSDVPADQPALGCRFDFENDGTFEATIFSGATGTCSTSKVFTDNGDHTVGIRVDDGDGGVLILHTTVTVLNVSPVVNAGPDITATEGTPVTFTASFTDPGADTHTCSWDFGDGTGAGPLPCTSGVTAVTKTFTDDTTVPAGPPRSVVLTVTDDEGASANDTALATVSDVSPTISAIVASSLTPTEGSVVTYTTTVGAGAAADPVTLCTWDPDGIGPLPGQAFAAGSTQCRVGTSSVFTFTYSDNSAFTPFLFVTDEDDTAGRAEPGMSVVNAAPTIVDITREDQVPEGQAASVTVFHADAGAADTHTFSFDFNNNGSCLAAEGDVCGSTLRKASRTYPDSGVHTVAVTVTDDDGGTVTGSTTLTVTNVAPTGSASNSGPVDEGGSVTVSATGADVAADLAVLTCAFDFNNTGTFGAPVAATAGSCSASNTYADDGQRTVAVRIADDDGGSTTVNTTVSVRNVAPTAVPNGCGTAANGAGGTYPCDLDATDPGGANDPITFLLVSGPEGMTVSLSTGVVAWTPTAAQTRSSHTYGVRLSDDDGGTRDFVQTVSSYLDTDGDGVPDAWEDAFGTDKNVADQTGDPDNDGVTNAEEFAAGTDPQVFDGPDRPVAISPVGGVEVTSTTPVLRIRNAVDPQGQLLTYELQVFPNAALSGPPAASATGVPEGTLSLGAEGGTATDWTVSTALSENTMYWWRARASDGDAPGAWTAVESFFVNSANDAPTAPTLSAPANSSEVSSLSPTLQIGNSSDVDRDALTYTFAVASDAAFGTTVVTSTGIPEGDSGTTSWVVTVALQDNTPYWWRASVSDGEGGSASSAIGTFFVNTSNDPPAPVALVSPADGAEVADTTPDLTVATTTDVDGDVLQYEFQVDLSPTFSAPSGGVVAQGAGTETTFTPATALADNTWHFWRARATDGFASGDWATGTFFVNTANDAPGTPVAQNPTGGMAVDRDAVVLSVRNTTDADGDALTYTFTIWKDEDRTEVFEEVPGVPAGADGQTIAMPATRLKGGKKYFWDAVAVDEESLAGSPSVLAEFRTFGVGGGGSGCAVGGEERAGAAAGVLAGFAGLALLLVRRRSSSGSR